MARAAELAHIGIYSRLAIGVGELWAMPHTILIVISRAGGHAWGHASVAHIWGGLHER